MNSQRSSFIDVVQNSRALSNEQKELFLGDPSMSEEYKKKITELLQIFDEKSKDREAYLRDKLEESYTQFISSLDEGGIGEEKKKELAEKARKQIEGFFPK